ncbi:aminotransferase [Sneathiella sp.]|jgi:aspartate/methionine/tyrosine aminotransferase|uniref:aminotransferase n=1 Tax=Sneathiella sp. TaxID=1964365 RepID=UPI0039E3D9FE
MPTASINPAVKALSAPPIPMVQKWGQSYDGALGPLLDLSQAVPGYPPHPDILNWLSEAARDTKLAGYGNIEGETELRTAYSTHVGERYQTQMSPQNIHITAGCNQAFITAIMTIAASGDSILISNPFYFNHESTLDMLNIKCKIYDTDAENGFLPNLTSMTEQIDPSVKAIVMISPNNPTGAIYPPALLEEAFSLCQKHGIWLVLDETYRDFLPSKREMPHTLFSHPNWGDNLIQLYSFSKSFCIPGHRLGSITAAPEVVNQIAKVMDNLQICAPRIPQWAVAKALPDLTNWREENRLEIAARSKTLQNVMTHCPDWKLKAVGAYFAYIEHPFEGYSSVMVAKNLARHRGIITIPGEFFGPQQSQYLRVAFANADQQMLEQLPERLNMVSLNTVD